MYTSILNGSEADIEFSTLIRESFGKLGNSVRKVHCHPDTVQVLGMNDTFWDKFEDEVVRMCEWAEALVVLSCSG